MQMAIIQYSSALGVLFATQMASAQLVVAQWPVSEGGNGHFYAVVPIAAGKPSTWNDARQYAIAMNGHLATSTSAAENTFLFNLCNAPQYWGSVGDNRRFGPWLGGKQLPGSTEPAGGWTWITGEPWQYTRWYPGEPNNVGGEDCLHFYTNNATRGPTWNDFGSARPFPFFMAEFDCIYVAGQPDSTTPCPSAPTTFFIWAGGDSVAFTWEYRLQNSGDWKTIQSGGNEYVEGSLDFSTLSGSSQTLELVPPADGWQHSYEVRCRLTSPCSEVVSLVVSLTPCRADADCSGFVDTDDFTAFVAAFEAGTDDADFDGSGFVDTDDFTAFVLAFEAGC